MRGVTYTTSGQYRRTACRCFAK